MNSNISTSFIIKSQINHKQNIILLFYQQFTKIMVPIQGFHIKCESNVFKLLSFTTTSSKIINTT